jgi:hypothetical protein
VAGVEHRLAGDDEAAEARARAGIDRQGVVAGVRLRVQGDVPPPGLDEWIALLGQLHAHVRLGGHDIGGEDRLAGVERQGLSGETRRAGLRPSHHDLAETVLLARGHRQDHRDRRVRRRLRSNGDVGAAVEIALRVQQPGQKVGVLLGPRPDLGRVGGVAAAGV